MASRVTIDPHATLEAWRRTLERPDRSVPGFDPNDGGALARLLILLETPGASQPAIVSRDNPSGTARNLTRFLAEAGIARRDTLLWNAVPWIVHPPGSCNRSLLRSEIREGLAQLPSFLALLPKLAVVVLSGRVAGEARGIVEANTAAPVLAMPHPSPTIVCTSPAIPARIRATLAEAARLLANP